MSGAAVETPADFGEAPDGLATRWKAEVRAFAKEREAWMDRVDGIERRYRDERDRKDEDRRFALLWANVEVLGPTLYARDPKPEVARRFKDRDPVGRVMAMILERNLDVGIDHGNGQFGRAMRSAVKDLLLGAQGQVWVRYGVAMDLADADGPDRGDDAAEGEQSAAPPVPVATDEWVAVDYVHWRDFGFTAGARVWDEVTAVWRRCFMTRDALVERFGRDVGNRVPLDAKKPGGADDREAATFAKATVYEVWDSDTRTTLWLHLGMDELLDERPYPLKLGGKFPCPTPLFGTLTNGSMVPVPDYVQYQDQAREMDELTGRIGALTEALQLRGLVPGDIAADVARALELVGEAQIIPVKSWAAFGGQAMSNLIVWLPIDMVVRVLSELLTLRERVKADAYEVTGLSDILRGSSAPQETATAQQLKAQWGSIRVRTRQQDVARFAAETLRLMAEVMVGHFDAGRLATLASVNALQPQDVALVGPALMALKGDAALVAYRVAVETDSTVEADQAADKEAWTELLQGVSAFLAAAGPVLQGVRQMAPAATPAFTAMLGEMLVGAVRRFKAGPQLETSIEAAFEALGQVASQPPAPQGPPQPDPVEVAKQQVAGAKVQVEGQKVQVAGAQVAAEQQRTQADMQALAHENAHRNADRLMEVARMAHEHGMAQQAAARAASAVPVGGSDE